MGFSPDPDTVRSEMEFLNGIFSRGSGHTVDSSFCLAFYHHFSILQNAFMNRLYFSFFVDFL